MSRRTSRNNNYSSGIRPSGIFRATVTAVNGSLVNVKIPRLGLDNIYEDCPVVGPIPSVDDNIFVGFLEGKTSSPVALTSTDANTGDIDSVIAGTALSGGGSSGDVTLNFAPSELSSATVSTSDKIVIADADDSDNPKTVTVQSIVDLSPGDITGVTAGTGISGGGTSGSVTLNFAPSELSSVTVASDDKVVIADTSDSDNPKHVTAQSIANLAASTPGGSTSQIQYNNSGSFAGSANFTFDGTSTITLTDTDAGSEAAPIIELYRNSASPADSDYLGQIKFQGENDADQKVVYAKITGKIDDASDTTEDGILEVMLQKAGSNNIAMRFTSTDMKLINGTGLQVDGNVGIGTTSPAEELHILKDQDGVLTQTLVENLDQRLRLGAYYEAGVAQYSKIQSEADNGSDQPLLLNPEGGNVGIGTTSPAATLDVAGDTTSTGHFTAQSGGADGGIVLGQTFSSSYVGLRTAGMGEASANEYVIMSSGTHTYISAASTGDVYIRGGGNDSSCQILLDTSEDHILITGEAGVGGVTPPSGSHLHVASQNRAVSVLDSGTSNYAELGFTSANSDSPAYGHFSGYDIGFKTGTSRAGLATAMHIDNDGSVGINDTTPSYKLDVNGNLRSTGHMYANDDFYVGSSGNGDSMIHFHDDNTNTWRTFRWDDSANEFIAEQNNGSSYPIWTQYRFRGGSATVAVNSSGYGTIAHGLPSTPDFAFVGARTRLSSDNDNQLAFPVTAADSTNITFRAYEINGNGNSNYTSSTIYSATVYVYWLAGDT